MKSKLPATCLALMLLGAALLCACSQGARYRVLSFFFDGVPDPNQPPAAPGYPVTAVPMGEVVDQGGRTEPVAVYAHPPFREGLCADCHNMNTGLLARTLSEGLCVMCHEFPSSDAPYLHGPVAAMECVACHHYHAAPYPKLLLEDPRTICARCHDKRLLGEAVHGALTEDQACIDCHNPHGGDDPFFLIESEP